MMYFGLKAVSALSFASQEPAKHATINIQADFYYKLQGFKECA